MELITLLLEFLKNSTGITTPLMFSFIMAILGHMAKENKKLNKAINERLDKHELEIKDRLDKQEDQINAIREEYQTGLKAIRDELDFIKENVLASIEEEQLENRKLTLRGLITNSFLPREYRLKSYDEYKTLNGNSWVKDYVDKYLINGESGE